MLNMKYQVKSMVGKILIKNCFTILLTLLEFTQIYINHFMCYVNLGTTLLMYQHVNDK